MTSAVEQIALLFAEIESIHCEAIEDAAVEQAKLQRPVLNLVMVGLTSLATCAEALQRIADVQEKIVEAQERMAGMRQKPAPTVAELEELLKDEMGEGTHDVRISPDGTVTRQPLTATTSDV
jgi:hypothetical protein